MNKIKTTLVNFLNENHHTTNNNFHHYIIHSKLGTSLDNMGEYIWIKAPKDMPVREIRKKISIKYPKVEKYHITQISKDLFDKHSKDFELLD